MAADFESTPAGRAAGYGWSLAVINSNPDLKRLFKEATDDNWTPDHFVAMVRGTKWFKKNADTARQAEILRKADPATYNARLKTTSRHIYTMANSMGARLTPANALKFSRDVVNFGWSDEQTKFVMSKYVRTNKAGNFGGAAGQAQSTINQIVGDYGGYADRKTMATWVQGMLRGTVTAEGVKSYMSTQAESKFPALAKRFRDGETLKQIAAPYMQTYAKILEVNPATLSLNMPSIQKALQAKNSKGTPVAKSIWEFEQDLRKDPRYMKTQQAQDSGMSMAKQVLRDFGIQN